MFAHLPALHTLDVSHTQIGDASLASMPPSLVSLHVRECGGLTRTAVLPRLPALQLLDVSGSGVGDVLVASIPAGLAELRMSRCRGVTAGATLDHVPALRTLHSYGTDLAPGVLAACRARGCVVPAAGVLRGCCYSPIQSLALLPNGQLATCDRGGMPWLWDVAASGDGVGWELRGGGWVIALAVLRDGRLATAVNHGRIEIRGLERPARVAGRKGMQTLAVLCDGRLAAGCDAGVVLIIDVDAGATMATLEGHTGEVTALAVLPDGIMASGSHDSTVRLWDVGAGTCIATLAGHSDGIRALAVPAGGRPARGADDGTVRLWDVSTRTCVCVLTGHSRGVTALAALLDGRLVSGSWDGSVRVWDARPVATSDGSRAAGAVPMAVLAHGLFAPPALVQLLDGRLAAAAGDTVHLLHVPPPSA